MNLGIPEAEFWTLHPGDFNHLVKRWEVNELRKELPLAQISMILVNQSRDTKKHPQPISIDEFLIVNRQPAKQATPESQEAQANAMLAYVEMLNAQFGGADLRPGHVTQSKEAIA